MRRLIAVLGFGLALPASALAAGGPVPPLDGQGVSAPGGPVSFVALASGPRHTIVERISRLGGKVQRYRTITGGWGVPGAAYDGSTTGLAANGRTLVLAQNSSSYPPTTTRLAVLETVRLKPVAHVTLPGAYAVDAISPDGRWLYLTHYKALPSTLDYEVLAYDLSAKRLEPQPIVDPREPDEKMQGQPVTRLMSPDGRWAYTLYDRGPQAPFIHALDTASRKAFCVDVPQVTSSNGAFDLRLALRRGGLEVLQGGRPVATMNTTTFAVKAPLAKPKPKPHADKGGGSGFPWEFGVIPAGAALVALAFGLRRRQTTRALAGSTTSGG
jgi:hypothetical protein